MKSQFMFKEDPVDSCRSIAHFLGVYRGSDPESIAKRALLLKDLLWRISCLDATEKATVMSESWYNLLPNEIRNQFPPESLGIEDLYRNVRSGKKGKKDVGIVTIIEPELRAVLLALYHEKPDKADAVSGPFRYWYGEIRRAYSRPLSAVITMVGEPRNVPCAIAVEHLLNDFELDLLVMVGIAAGTPKEKVNLGDVVCAERVYDYEHVRLELSKLRTAAQRKSIRMPRPQFWEVKKEIKIALELCNEKKLQERFLELVDHADTNELPKEIAERNFKPALHKGTIAAGEKLFADRSLRKMYRFVDQRIRAGDQEDSGFAQVAEIKELPWCIFRGICDYGDPIKNDKWHFASSLSAAAASITFLRSAWNKPQ
jgi:nucleoside phosphorylase